MTAVGLSFRSLSRDEFPLLASWLAQPHVAQWWDTLDLAGVEREFGPCIDGRDPTKMFICAEGGSAVGLIQFYRLSDNLDYQHAVMVDDGAGIDLLIGAADQCGKGLGPRMICGVLDMVWDSYPEVRCAMAGPSVHNTRSHRAFEKAGFQAVRRVAVPGEKEDELILVCPRPTTA